MEKKKAKKHDLTFPPRQARQIEKKRLDRNEHNN